MRDLFPRVHPSKALKATVLLPPKNLTGAPPGRRCHSPESLGRRRAFLPFPGEVSHLPARDRAQLLRRSRAHLLTLFPPLFRSRSEPSRASPEFAGSRTPPPTPSRAYGRKSTAPPAPPSSSSRPAPPRRLGGSRRNRSVADVLDRAARRRPPQPRPPERRHGKVNAPWPYDLFSTRRIRSSDRSGTSRVDPSDLDLTIQIDWSRAEPRLRLSRA